MFLTFDKKDAGMASLNTWGIIGGDGCASNRTSLPACSRGDWHVHWQSPDWRYSTGSRRPASACHRIHPVVSAIQVVDLGLDRRYLNRRERPRYVAMLEAGSAFAQK